MISVCMVSREYFGRGLCFWMERIPGTILFYFKIPCSLGAIWAEIFL